MKIVLIVLLAIAMSVSISATLIVAGLLLVEWGVRWKRGETPPWRASAIDLPLLVMFVWTAIAATLVGSTGAIDAVGGQSALLLFLWAAHSLDEKRALIFFRWFCIGAVAMGLLGVLQHFSGINYRPTERIYEIPDAWKSLPPSIIKYLAVRNDRAVGPRSHPLTYCESFIPAFFLLLDVLARKFRAREWNAGFFSVAVAFGMVAGGVIFGSGRAVWLALLVGALVFAWRLNRLFFLRTLFVGLIVAGPLVAFGPAGFRGRLFSIVSSNSGSEGDQQSKMTRYTLWTQALEQIKQHPIAGVGFRGVHLTSIDPVSGQPREWTETHNMYLQHALELGFVGFGFFLWTLAACASVINRLSDRWRPLYSGMLVAFLIAGITEAWTHDKEIAMIFWTFIGFATLLKQNEQA